MAQNAGYGVLFGVSGGIMNLIGSKKGGVTPEQLEALDAWWRASNYLAASELYLLDNPLLRDPLTEDVVKKKIVGHWGTVPGQNFIYTHLDRVINKYDLDMLYRLS